MLHQAEYRLYMLAWGLLPLLLAVTVFRVPAFRERPRIQIEVRDSVPDYLYKAKEVISLRYKVEGLSPRQLKATWTFGDSVYAWQEVPVTDGRYRLVSRLVWEEGEKKELGFKPVVHYDTLPPRTRFGWRSVAQVSDSVVKIQFPRPGAYRFKLTLVDTLTQDTLMDEALVQVVRATSVFPRDTAVKIVGPTKGLVGEELVFSATGSKVNFWYWKFGDGKNQDATQPQVLYSFSQEGRWEVTLKTDNPDRWFSHWVEISPTWNADSLPVEAVDTTADLIPRYQLDLRRRLQAIANTSTSDFDRFYTLKDHIQRNYLSERLGTIDVWVNKEEEPVDFDSYCQRIHFLEGDVKIKSVRFDWDGDSTRRKISTLYVQQASGSE